MHIRETAIGGDLTDFLDVVDLIYRDDPAYIRPLDMELKDRLHPKKNPFFQHAEGTTFTAHKTGRCVGRITAQIDRLHLEKYNDQTGSFGLLDTTNDPEVAKLLLVAAEDWLARKGMRHVRGPFSLSLNEEAGTLVEGFEHPPVVMTPHHRDYQGRLIEACGYSKEKDLLAWRYEVGDMNTRVRKAHADILAMPEVTSRPVSLRHAERDTQLCIDIFNDAWSENWGTVAVTRAEASKSAGDLRLLLIPEITRIISIDGEPAAFAIALPNINELIGDLNGKLLPFGLAKLVYRLKVVGPKSGRQMLLGIRKKYRNIRKYAGLSLFMYAEMNDSGRQLGMTWGELSWTLEDNGPVNMGIRAVGARVYKKYRIYKKSL
jgi:hypothetical protein